MEGELWAGVLPGARQTSALYAEGLTSAAAAMVLPPLGAAMAACCYGAESLQKCSRCRFLKWCKKNQEIVLMANCEQWFDLDPRGDSIYCRACK